MIAAGPLSIGLLLDRFEPRRGGAERYLAALFADLAARGHDCRVYCVRGADLPSGVGQETVPLRSRTRAGREREFSRRSVEAARSAGRLVYAVRHVSDADLYQPHGGTWAATTEARRQVHPAPLLHRLWRGLDPRYRFLAWADEEVFRRRPGLLTVAVSSLVREDILRRYGQYRPDVQVVSPWVDPPAQIRERRRDPGSLVVGFLAHNFLLKGLDVLLQALGERALQGATLQVGGRADPAPWRRRVRRLGLGNRVSFLGEVVDAPEFWSGIDLLVHPTRHDPCALACLEALAHGVAVVTTAANGAAPFVRGAGGVVLDGLEAGRLAEAVLRCARQAADPAGCRRAVAGLTREAHVDRMEELLRQAAATGRP